MDRKQSVQNILSKYDKEIKDMYTEITILERDTRHKIKRQEVRASIKDIIERVIRDEVK